MVAARHLMVLVIYGFLVICGLFLVLTFGGNRPPGNVNNICHMFTERFDWYKSLKASEKKWSLKIPVAMAIIHQESGFRSDAQPPRRHLFGERISSAYGYSQALDGTWARYMKSTGNLNANRSSFADAVDFIGWYNNLSLRKNGIKAHDAYNLYFAYHEGHSGFARRSYNSKKWLRKVAKKVQRRAKRYEKQYKKCHKKLEQRLNNSWF